MYTVSSKLTGVNAEERHLNVIILDTKRTKHFTIHIMVTGLDSIMSASQQVQNTYNCIIIAYKGRKVISLSTFAK